MRCFIAIELPEAVKEELKSLTARLKPLSRGIRWAAVEGIHLTLKFLGEVREDAVAGVSNALTGVCAAHRPFNILIRGTGAFPGMRYPRVIWVGIERRDDLQALQRDIDEALALLGFEREQRTFTPHLTLGRVKEGDRVDAVMKEVATFGETVFGTIDVAQVVLMKSTLKPSGAEYSPIAVCRLGSKEER